MEPRIAVVDVETTGLSPGRSDRIIEVAFVIVVPGLGIVSELETLVNPERDVGPTSIHGLTASHVLEAPLFSEIAGHLTDALRSVSVLSGHNIQFDISFLRAEYARMGVAVPAYDTIDTMAMAGGGSLETCCEREGVPFSGIAHSALGDARATAALMERLIDAKGSDACIVTSPPTWPPVPCPTRGLLARETVILPEPDPAGLESPSVFEGLTEPGLFNDPASDTWRGLRVCFTGESRCSLSGCPLTRRKAELLAEDMGFIVARAVTKRVDLLVASDVNSLSRKAQQARLYGVRIVNERRFWSELGHCVD